MAKTTFLEHAMINHMLRDTDFAAPATVYVALAISGTEVTGGGYARAAIAKGSANWSAPSNGSTSNVNAVEFPVPTADWGAIDQFTLYDAASAGNRLYEWTNLATTVTILNGQSEPTFQAGTLTVTES